MSDIRYQDTLRPVTGFAGGFASTGPGRMTRLFGLLTTWQRRASERRHLMRLDDRLLADIGLSRADVEREYRTPFWR